MKRFRNNEPCSFGHEITLRMTRTVSNDLFTHMRKDSRHEQMAFALGRRAKTAEGTVFFVKDVILPDQDDLDEQSVAGVCPTQELQSYVYHAAHRSGSTIVEFHTHPGTSAPHFRPRQQNSWVKFGSGRLPSV